MKERIKTAFGAEKIIPRALAAWCWMNFVTMLMTPENFTSISYGFEMNIITYAFSLVMLFITLSAVDFGFPILKSDYWVFGGGAAVFAVYLLTIENNIWLCLSLLGLAALAICYLVKDDKLGLSRIKLGKRSTVATVAVCGLISFAVISVFTCLRYATYSTPNFDFGIFCNMFYYMKKTLLPLVSCERDKILSHFAVHISPIYYLLLPLYAVFPSPYTLQIGQAIVIAGGIIPMYLLAKEKGLGNRGIALLSVAYAFSPVLICGTSYDIHENAFLLPLLLWAFYFFEKQKYPLMYISCLLVCLVKEDAPLFILFLGIYLIISRKKLLHGVVLSVASLAYFGLAIFLLMKFGDGVFSDRFMNYMYDDHGLIGMARIIITNPGYVFTQTLNSDKLIYLLQILLPLGLLPLASKKVSQLILLLPFLVENLMTSYIYQYSIDFQYTYGAIACFIYLTVINTKNVKTDTRRIMCTFAAVASIFIFTVTAGDRISYLVNRYQTGKPEFEIITQTLDTLPENASVKASTFFVPRISERDEIYDIKSENETDYVVFDMRSGLIDETTELRQQYFDMGYTVYSESEGYVLILKNPSA